MKRREPLVRTVRTSAVATPRTLRACGVFGVRVRSARCALPVRARRALEQARRGEVVLLSGPSGAGKSTLLRAMVRTLRAVGTGVHEASLAGVDHGLSVVDCVPGDLDDALHALGLCGLGDALVLAQSAGSLSEGERARLALARALASSRATGEGVVVVDELCSGLDAVTARGVARGLARGARHWGVGVLAASTREEAQAWLEADTTVRVRPRARA